MLPLNLGPNGVNISYAIMHKVRLDINMSFVLYE
jgi:hypothetical protein